MKLKQIFYRFAASLEKAQGSQRLYVLLVYFSILLDNLLLTAVGMLLRNILEELILEHSSSYSRLSRRSSSTKPAARAEQNCDQLVAWEQFSGSYGRGA